MIAIELLFELIIVRFALILLLYIVVLNFNFNLSNYCKYFLIFLFIFIAHQSKIGVN